MFLFLVIFHKIEAYPQSKNQNINKGEDGYSSVYKKEENTTLRGN